MNKILTGSCADHMAEWKGGVRFNCVVTSPPYWGLRDYGVDGQFGLEPTVNAYVERLVSTFDSIRQHLADDGTVWLNIGDGYAGSNKSHRASGLKNKDLMGIPWRTALALQADGWWLRNAVIWHKPNCSPSSVKDRLTTSYEHIFFLSKSERYWYDADAIAELAVSCGKLAGPNALRGQGSNRSSGKQANRPGRDMSAVGATRGSGNKHRKTNADRGRPDSHLGGSIHWEGTFTRNARDVWSMPVRAFAGAHMATMPVEVAELCILAGCPTGGLVYDPFFGAGTTGIAALQQGRRFVGSEINPQYVEMAKRRIDPIQRSLQLGLTV
jgi:DNA modification methylase